MGGSRSSEYSQQVGLKSGNLISKRKSSNEFMTDRGNRKD